MTREEFTARFPHASEMTIRLNCDDVAPRPVSSPTPACQMPENAKEQPASKPARKLSKRVLLPRTRNAGTMTENGYWGALRSMLRQFSMRHWKPRKLALDAAKIPFNGPNGQRVAFRCCVCRGAFKRDEVEVDHVESCGTLKSHEDLGPFVARLLAEDPKAWRVMCAPCHLERTNAARSLSPLLNSSQSDLPI